MLLDDSAYCSDCGSSVEVNVKPGSSYADLPFGIIVDCPECGSKNTRTDSQCKKCDADLTSVKIRLSLEKSSGIACPKCGIGNPTGSRYCRKCGAGMTDANSAPPQPVMLKCKYCGTRNGPTASKCSSCGANL